MAVEVESQQGQHAAGAVSSTDVVPMDDRVGDQMPAPKQVPKRAPLPANFVWTGTCATCDEEIELPFHPQIGVDATCNVCRKKIRGELDRVTKEALLEMGQGELEEWMDPNDPDGTFRRLSDLVRNG